MSTESFVGLDVAKADVDVAVRPSGEPWRVANDEAGIAQLVARLRALQPTVVVAEATGGAPARCWRGLGGALSRQGPQMLNAPR